MTTDYRRAIKVAPHSPPSSAGTMRPMAGHGPAPKRSRLRAARWVRDRQATPPRQRRGGDLKGVSRALSPRGRRGAVSPEPRSVHHQTDRFSACLSSHRFTVPAQRPPTRVGFSDLDRAQASASCLLGYRHSHCSATFLVGARIYWPLPPVCSSGAADRFHPAGLREDVDIGVVHPPWATRSGT